MNTKSWYSSKIVWFGVITTLMGILPLVNVYVQVVAPQVALVVAATVTLVSGILTVIARVWFTNTELTS